MRHGAFAAVILVAGCTMTPQGAPVWYKTPAKAAIQYDGVDLTLICELADRLGTDYLAPDLTHEEAQAMPDMWGQLEMLSLDNVSCGRPGDLLDLPFVSDPQRRLVSTWSEIDSSEVTEAWASCLADTTRAQGDRVVYCEVTDAVAVPIAPQTFEPLSSPAEEPDDAVADKPTEVPIED